MEIKEYLEDIITLPLEKLKEKYGNNPVYDNYRIFLNGSLDKIKEIIENSEKFEFKKTINSNRTNHIFHYTPGIIYLQLSEGSGHQFEKGYEQILKDFNHHLTLHPYQEKNMKDITFEEGYHVGTEKSKIALSRGINDISKILMENKIPFCIPCSSKGIFEEQVKERDYSEMAKFIPK